VTGAGRKPAPHLHFPEAHDSFFAYGCGDHRHQPEIGQALTDFAHRDVDPLFVPHLLPIDRGILATMYLEPADDSGTEDGLHALFEQAYADQPFVRVRRSFPNVKHVRDTNYCDLAVRLTEQRGWRRIVVFAALDNMIKGASGQAVQNMNLMFGFAPGTGLA
jgi:N-acetyl-gamma-glutamyl-phosphate reductase